MNNNNIIIKDKVQFNLFISRGVKDKFRHMVALKYQTVERGMVSYEVEQALISWMSMVGTQTQDTQSKIVNEKANPIPVVHQLKMNMCKYIMDTKDIPDCPQFVPQKFLFEAISALKGTDKRTVKKWIDLLKQYGCIKRVGDYQWEIM